MDEELTDIIRTLFGQPKSEKAARERGVSEPFVGVGIPEYTFQNYRATKQLPTRNPQREFYDSQNDLIKQLMDQIEDSEIMQNLRRHGIDKRTSDRYAQLPFERVANLLAAKG